MTVTSEQIAAARERNAMNSEASRLYQRLPYRVTDYEMMIASAADAVDYIVKMLALSVERPDLGYTKFHAHDVFCADVAAKVRMANRRLEQGAIERAS